MINPSEGLSAPATKPKAKAKAIKKLRLKKGQTAPYTGFLLSDAALARIIARYEKKADLLALELRKEKEKNKLVLNNANTTCKVQLDSKDRQIKILEKAQKERLSIYKSSLARAYSPLRHPAFTVSLGAVAGAGV